MWDASQSRTRDPGPGRAISTRTRIQRIERPSSSSSSSSKFSPELCQQTGKGNLATRGKTAKLELCCPICIRYIRCGTGTSWRRKLDDVYLEVSKNGGTPKSSIFMGFSVINHPFLGTPVTMEPPKLTLQVLYRTGVQKGREYHRCAKLFSLAARISFAISSL